MDAVRGPAELFDLTDRVALVTGASSGLGRRFARVLAAAGANVAVSARRADRLAELATEDERIVAFPADLSDEEARIRLVADVRAALGPVDILVNNAGATTDLPIERETVDDLRASLELNLVAAWHLTKLCGESMVERRCGSVINIASVLGLVGATPVKNSTYAAAKGGLVNLTRETALQWARKGVRVNAICPGWFTTEMTEGLTSTDRGAAFIDESTPMNRIGSVEELDGALLLLASDAGSYMTGSMVVVDGGWTAR